MQTPARVTKGKGKAGKAGKGHANADIPTKRVQVKIEIADFTITILSTHPKLHADDKTRCSFCKEQHRRQ